ncbi:YSIRK-type signal peptide-containing protein [Staphylococcus simulans]
MKKKQHFSLRKLSVGIASVSLGSVVLLSGTQSAQAETNNTNDPAVQKQIELSQKVAAEQEQKAQDQKAIDKQVELAKKAGTEQAQIEAAKKAAKEQVAKAKAEVNKLENLSKKVKASYNAQIAKAATADIAGIVQNAKAQDSQVATAKKVAAEQQQIELAKKANAQQAQVELAQKAAAEQVAKAQAEVNNLQNISKENKATYNAKIAKAATADIPAIVKDAKAVDAQIELAKKAENEQKQIENAKKVAAEQVAKAQAEVNKLENLSKEKKAEYNKQIAAAAVADIPGIVQNAKAVDFQVGFAKKAANEQVAKAQKEINSLTHLTKEEKASFNKKVAEAATADVSAIVKEAKDADAAKAKQKPVKKEVKKQNNVVTNPNTKVNNNGKAVTGQKDSKTTTTTNKAQQKANTQQKAKDAKKQLPATGEQDQVLFGLLSGSLFASAGTLFLLNARRKENE